MLSLSVLVLALALVADAAQTLDVTNQPAVLAAMKAAMPGLAVYYNQSIGGVDNFNQMGAWIEQYDDTHHVVQWHESGMYWGFFYEYVALTGDISWLNFVDSNIQLALSNYNGKTAFLDQSSAISGRWNDDIGWWGLALMTAAEAMPSGKVAAFNVQDGANPTYLSVADATHAQMYENWDTNCGGGIFWSRNRNAAKATDANYKSAITNAQHVDLSARLLASTGDKKHQQLFDQVYDWMKTALINPSTYEVSDGVDNRDCSKSPLQFSYHSGELLAATALMFKATNQPKYLEEAHKHFAHIFQMFTKDNVLYDPQCEVGCGKSSFGPTGYHWAVYKGLANLYAVTDQGPVKTQIIAIMQATGAQVLQTCDSKWMCIRKLDDKTDFTLWDGTNVRDQFEVMSFLNAAAIISGMSIKSIVQDTTPAAPQVPVSPQSGGNGGSSNTPKSQSPTGDTKSGNSNSSGSNNTMLYAGIGGGAAALLIIFGLIAFCYVRAKKRNAAMRQQMQQGQMSEKFNYPEDRSYSRTGPQNYPSQGRDQYSGSRGGNGQGSPRDQYAGGAAAAARGQEVRDNIRSNGSPKNQRGYESQGQGYEKRERDGNRQQQPQEYNREGRSNRQEYSREARGGGGGERQEYSREARGGGRQEQSREPRNGGGGGGGGRQGRGEYERRPRN
ncbi:hydrolase 76 protein [Chytriomyces hyalinus]|nr:hydrolase 76 protein [Chytriomyces hyalinus]